ncbi:MAG TPA: lipid-A-disaccharide synthase [Candidatus Hydrogenedentes bacterium]|nr:lipid-A-disaccharide synthase [Candidatus Hydrogenedentota bacterium]
MRVFLIAGESSGDLHGANVIRALRAACPEIVCEGLGGQRMAEAGMALRYDLAREAVMGFTEVVRAFPGIRRLFLDTVRHISACRPDVVVLIDYPGFNIRMGEKVKELGIPVVYYISPQVWAWKQKRIHTIARFVSRMLVILPFEEELYRQIGVPCAYVGHPLLDHIASRRANDDTDGRLVIGLLPGSREQEIRRLMPTMIETAEGIRQRYPDARFLTPCVDTVREAQVRALADRFPVETLVGRTYDVLAAARFCLVASGTATLETALFGVPMAILYRTSPINYWIARRVVSIKHIGIVNIIAGREVVPEFIQHEARAEAILPRALELIDDTPARQRVLADLAEVKARLGDAGASMRAARHVLEVAKGAAYG